MNITKIISYIPNTLSITRILLSPIIGYTIYIEIHKVLSLVLMFIAFMTDYFDGYISRKFNIYNVSFVCITGGMWDRIADRILTACIMYSLFRLHGYFILKVQFCIELIRLFDYAYAFLPYSTKKIIWNRDINQIDCYITYLVLLIYMIKPINFLMYIAFLSKISKFAYPMITKTDIYTK